MVDTLWLAICNFTLCQPPSAKAELTTSCSTVAFFFRESLHVMV